MGRRIGREASQRLLALALGADRPAATGLVGEDDGMDEALEEVALVLARRPPGRLERLVGLEVAAPAGQREPVPVVAGDVSRPAQAWRGSCSSGSTSSSEASSRRCFREHRFAHDRGDRPARSRDRRHRPRSTRRRRRRAIPDVPLLGFTNHTDTIGLRARPRRRLRPGGRQIGSVRAAGGTDWRSTDPGRVSRR